MPRFATTCLLVASLPVWSQCSAPSSPGVRICTPTNNSIGAQPGFAVAINSTPSAGASMSKIIIYDNNRPSCTLGPGQNGVTCIDSHYYNGPNHIVVNAWDSNGHFYQARTFATVWNGGNPPCTRPSSPGVVVCNPKSGDLYGLDPQVDAAATGTAAITSLAFYVDGKLVQKVPNTWGAGIGAPLPDQFHSHVVTVIATDAAGHHYSANRTLKAAYTYGSGWGCFYGSCYTGINIYNPGTEEYVDNNSPIRADIGHNPHPITRMTAYIDSTLVASSIGSTIEANLHNIASGTHALTVQGWDTAGHEYRAQETINVNVSH